MGAYNFWYQMLVGDTVDNIKGCPGIGPVKAKKVLEPGMSEGRLYESVLSEYIHTFNDYKDAITSLTINGKLLWILRTPDQVWEPPSLKPEPLFASTTQTVIG